MPRSRSAVKWKGQAFAAVRTGSNLAPRPPIVPASEQVSDGYSSYARLDGFRRRLVVFCGPGREGLCGIGWPLLMIGMAGRVTFTNILRFLAAAVRLALGAAL